MRCSSPIVPRTLVCDVELGQPQVFSAGSSPPRSQLGACQSGRLFSLDLHLEVLLTFDFVVHPIRWERCPLVAADLHASSWLTLQSRRGLAPNTLDAYSRALERYLRFLESRNIASSFVTRGDVGHYLAGFQAGLSNATVQQLLTVVRLFH